MSSETFKGGVHAATGALATTMLLYNALAWQERRETRLVLNVAIYAALCAWELRQTHWHWSKVER